MVLNTKTHGFNAFIAGIERNFAHSSFGLRQHQRRVAGQADVSDALAAQDAQAIMNYFRLCSVLADRRR